MTVKYKKGQSGPGFLVTIVAVFDLCLLSRCVWSSFSPSVLAIIILIAVLQFSG